MSSAYCWSSGLRPYIAGKSQAIVAGVVRAGDAVLFKRSGGELRVRLADGTVHTMPVPKDQTFYVYANLRHKDDEVELLPVSPAEAATL